MGSKRAWSWVLGGALCGGLAAWLAVSVPVTAAVKIPADFTFEQGKDSPGKVTFSHAKHAEAVGGKCTACHTKIFKMKRGATGAFTMDAMKKGMECGACHNGKTEVNNKTPFAVADKANCEHCHKK
jgi:c(7)-type cytochrome triheme protein